MPGVSVKLEDFDTGNTVTYQLVKPDKSEPERVLSSVASPIGRALLGKRVDEEARVNTPGGLRDFLVLEIE